jgi:hypothetical protein
MAGTTALLRRIERENQTRIAAEYAERLEAARSGTRAKGLPRWAVDQMLAAGDISPDQHSAAHRYRKALERSQPGGGGNAPKVDGGDSDPHARLWDAAQSAQVARTARSWVLASPSTRRTRARVLDRLFAFPCPSLEKMRTQANGKTANHRLPRQDVVRRCAHVCELLEVFFEVMDVGYGQRPERSNILEFRA